MVCLKHLYSVSQCDNVANRKSIRSVRNGLFSFDYNGDGAQQILAILITEALVKEVTVFSNSSVKHQLLST